MMGAWIVSKNIAGYLPMDDEPATFAEWDEAAEHYKEFVREWADQSDEDYDDMDSPKDDWGSDRTTVDSMLADDPLVEGKDYGMTVYANDGNTMSLWLVWSDDVESPEDDDEPETGRVHQSITGNISDNAIVIQTTKTIQGGITLN